MLTDGDVEQLETLRADLPADVPADISDAALAELLLGWLIESRQPPRPFPEAEDAFVLWKNMNGSAAVPIDRALALYEDKTPLITGDELVAEDRYRYPTALHQPPAENDDMNAIEPIVDLGFLDPDPCAVGSV